VTSLSAAVAPPSITKENAMGYYITLADASFDVPETNEVLQVIKDANVTYHDWKRGGSYSGGEQRERWFSWLPKDYDKTITSVKEFFDLLGFDSDAHDGLVRLMAYDSKIGQEELFLAIVAPFVEEGSFLEWRGEDGSMWRHEVMGGKLHIAEVAMTYRDFKPVRLLEYEFINDTLTPLVLDPYAQTAPHAQYTQQASVSA